MLTQNIVFMSFYNLKLCIYCTYHFYRKEVFNILPSMVNAKRGPVTSGPGQIPCITSNVPANDSFEDIRADTELQMQDLSMTDKMWARFTDKK